MPKKKEIKGKWKVIYTFRKDKPTTLEEALADKRCWKAIEKYTGKTIQEIQKDGEKRTKTKPIDKRACGNVKQPAKRRRRTT